MQLVEQQLQWPGPDEILIRVRSFGLSGPDVLQRREAFVAGAGHSPVLGQVKIVTI